MRVFGKIISILAELTLGGPRGFFAASATG